MSDNKKVSGSMLALAIDKMLDLLDDKADQTEVEKKANASDLATKQDKLTFDSTPTANSTNPVTSDGIYSAFTSLPKNIAYATCATAPRIAEKEIIISGDTNWELTVGSLIVIKFEATNTAPNPKFNVNGTGAKSILYNDTTITIGSSRLQYAGYQRRPMLYMYDGTYFVFMGWSYDTDTNTTYTNASLGQGYATCSTDATTIAKTASLSKYSLETGGIVSVKFTYDVPAGSTLNVNSEGAQSIYYRGAAITDGIIKAGDTATFIYNTYYHLISIDRWQDDITGLNEALDTKQDLLIFDGTPTTGSDNPVTSGGIKAALDNYVTEKELNAKGYAKLSSISLLQTEVDKKANASDLAVKQDRLDTLNWLASTLPSNSTWKAIAYGNGVFVAIANDSNKTAYSTDGENWTETTNLPSESSWYSITYGNGKFVAVAYGTVAAYSSDGITWTAATLPSSRNWCSVAYGNGMFVAIAGSSNIAAYSTDGINWHTSDITVGVSWQAVAYGDGMFVAIEDGTTVAAYSTDGINWSAGTLPQSTRWRSLTYGNGRFVTVAYNTSIAAYSTDGVHWTESTLPEKSYWCSVVYGNGMFVVVTYNSTISAYSTDGENWTEIALPYTSYGFAATYGNGIFAAVGYSTDRAVYAKVTELFASRVDRDALTDIVKNTLEDVVTPTADTHAANKKYVDDITDTKAPLAHASQHKTGGVDPITPEDIGASRVNPNLLDNWYFGNPVNQRGQTEYKVNSYTIDRWKSSASSNTIAIADGCINFTVASSGQSIQQPMHWEELKGKTITASMLLAAGATARICLIVTGGTTMRSSYISNGIASVTATIPEEATNVYVAIQANTVNSAVKLVAAKLELGTLQTLAHQENGNWVLNEIPDYNEQLLRCCMSTADSEDTYANNKRTSAVIGAMGFRRLLTSADDLNDIVEGGIYLYYTGDIPANCPYQNAGVVEVIQTNSTTGRLIQRVTRYGTSGYMAVRSLDAGTWRDWAEFATTDYAVPLDGSKAMTGALNFQTVNNGSGRVQKSHSATADYGTIIRDYDKNGNFLSVVIRAAMGTVSVAGSDGVAKEILHTGNTNRTTLVSTATTPTVNNVINWTYK